MLVKEDIPQSVMEEACCHLDGDEEIRIAVSSDIKSDGRFGSDWVLATSSQLIVLDGNDTTPQLVHKCRLSNIEDIACDCQVGNGFLNAVIDGQRVCLARYSSANTRKFTAAARQLEALSRGDEPAPDPDTNHGKCPKCGASMDSSNQCSNCNKRGRAIIRLLGFLQPYRWSAMLIMILLLISTLTGLIPPYLCKLLMDKAFPGDSRYLLTVVVLGLFGTAFLSAGLSILHGRAGAWLGAKATHSIRTSLCEHVEDLSISFYDKRKVGDVVGLINYDTQEVQGFLSSEMYFLVSQIILLIGGLGMLLWLNWQLGAAVLVPVIISGLLAYKLSKGMKNIYAKYWHRRGRFGTTLNDSLYGLRTVKAFAQEEVEKGRLYRSSEAFMTASGYADAAWCTLVPSLVFIMSIGSYLVWWLGGLQVIGDRLSIGGLMATLGYVGIISGPIQTVFGMGDRITRVLSATGRIFDLLDTQPEEAGSEASERLPFIQGHIEFRDVTFGYDAHNPVLHNINFDIKPGEMIGLVGCSGAGKTTIINLICRFYQAQEGHVLIDGVDTRHIDLHDLRSQISVVQQDAFLFDGTIGENIAYSRPFAPMDDIITAARAANAHDFITSFPEGYETWVGQGGQNLSGGERQRIVLARAILRNPRIFILDEATSAVDTASEMLIQDALSRFTRGRTTIAIAHRLSTLRNADRLIVLSSGRIMETGTHDELLAERGEYYRLARMQLKMSHGNEAELWQI